MGHRPAWIDSSYLPAVIILSLWQQCLTQCTTDKTKGLQALKQTTGQSSAQPGKLLQPLGSLNHSNTLVVFYCLPLAAQSCDNNKVEAASLLDLFV